MSGLNVFEQTRNEKRMEIGRLRRDLAQIQQRVADAEEAGLITMMESYELHEQNVLRDLDRALTEIKVWEKMADVASAGHPDCECRSCR